MPKYLQISRPYTCLEGEKEEESHHETEKSHGFGQSKSKNSVREQLLLEGRIPGVSDDQRSEHRSNSSSRASNTDSGGTSSNELSGRVNIRLYSCGLESSGLRDGSLTDHSPLPDHLVGGGGDSEPGNCRHDVELRS